MIIVNFKNYKTGKEALRLVKKLQKAKGFIGAVNFLDIQELSKTKLPIFAQHIDLPSEKQASTGFVFPEQIKKAGAKGTLLNHSEHRISFNEIKKNPERM